MIIHKYIFSTINTTIVISPDCSNREAVAIESLVMVEDLLEEYNDDDPVGK